MSRRQDWFIQTYRKEIEVTPTHTHTPHTHTHTPHTLTRILHTHSHSLTLFRTQTELFSFILNFIIKIFCHMHPLTFTSILYPYPYPHPSTSLHAKKTKYTRIKRDEGSELKFILRWSIIFWDQLTVECVTEKKTKNVHFLIYLTALQIMKIPNFYEVVRLFERTERGNSQNRK